jgi:hypothetical protein
MLARAVELPRAQAVRIAEYERNSLKLRANELGYLLMERLK